MSTQFDDIMNGDVIDASHVTEAYDAIHDLESGAAHYRKDDSSTVNDHQVNFATGNQISSYSKGMMIHFRSGSTNDGLSPPTLTVTGPSGALDPIALVKQGGTALAASDIVSGQLVSAVYIEEDDGSNPRFEVLNPSTSSGGGGGGASSLNQLADVTVSSSAQNEILMHDGTDFKNVGPAAARTGLDVPSNADLAAKQDSSARGMPNGYASLDANGVVPAGQLPTGTGGGGATALNQLSDVSVSMAAQDEILMHDGTDFKNVGASAARAGLDVPSNADLAGKADVSHSHPTSEITGLDTALTAKQETSEKGQANGYAELDSSGKVPSSQLPTASGGTVTVGVNQVAFGDSNGEITSEPGINVTNGQLNLSNNISSPGAGVESQRFGAGSVASNTYSTAVGHNASATSISGTSFGAYSEASGHISTAIGGYALCKGNQGVAIGYDAQAGDPLETYTVGAIAIGKSSRADIESCIALGIGASSTWLRAIAMGAYASAQSHQSIAHGFLAEATAENAVAFGPFAKSSGLRSITVGPNTEASYVQSIAIGYESEATNHSSVALGSYAKATGGYSVSLGYQAEAQGAFAIAGPMATAAHNYSLAIGRGAVTTSTYQAVLGGPIGVVQDLYVGSGVTYATPSDVNIRATGASGTDAAPAQMRIAGGISTGSASGGSVRIATSPAGSSGSSPNTLVDHLIVDGEGRIGFHGAAPAAQSTGWSISNASTSKSLDVSNGSLADVREIVGTMVETLKANGLLGA